MQFTTIRRIYKVDSAGNVVIPIGIEFAGMEVDVTIRPVPVGATTTDWADFANDPEFERHEADTDSTPPL